MQYLRNKRRNRWRSTVKYTYFLVFMNVVHNGKDIVPNRSMLKTPDTLQRINCLISTSYPYCNIQYIVEIPES